jgi:hypothetical protein
LITPDISASIPIPIHGPLLLMVGYSHISFTQTASCTHQTHQITSQIKLHVILSPHAISSINKVHQFHFSTCNICKMLVAVFMELSIRVGLIMLHIDEKACVVMFNIRLVVIDLMTHHS